jgi:hypothetical protein
MTDDLHRRFGVEGNNTTWALLDEGGPGADAPRHEQDRFLYRAYASAYHWMETPSGTVANVARGEHLIARAAISVGRPELALRHARRCIELCEANPADVADWDLAFGVEALARALAAAGEPDAERQWERAHALGEAIVEDDDREVFLAELRREPWFGIET